MHVAMGFTTDTYNLLRLLARQSSNLLEGFSEGPEVDI